MRILETVRALKMLKDDVGLPGGVALEGNGWSKGIEVVDLERDGLSKVFESVESNESNSDGKNTVILASLLKSLCGVD